MRTLIKQLQTAQFLRGDLRSNRLDDVAGHTVGAKSRENRGDGFRISRRQKNSENPRSLDAGEKVFQVQTNHDVSANVGRDKRSNGTASPKSVSGSVSGNPIQDFV